jgi:thiamine biosynthesis lipoprotein
LCLCRARRRPGRDPERGVRRYRNYRAVGPALDAALDRIAQLEDVLTTWRPDGELARLNTGAGVSPRPMSEELFRALDAAHAWARRTGGHFDPTVGALIEVWGLRTGGRVPDDAALSSAMARTSWRHLALDGESSTAVYAVEGLNLDLGAFGKGWALDEAAGVLRRHGVRDALLNFGGQVLALGAPPGEPGWIVDVADPGDRMRPVASLRVRDASVATSANTERRHLLDPTTGRLVEHRASATVIAPTAAAADALATAMVVAGPDEGAAYLPADATFLYLEPSPEPGGQPVATRGPRLDALLIDNLTVVRSRTAEETRPDVQ